MWEISRITPICGEEKTPLPTAEIIKAGPAFTQKFSIVAAVSGVASDSASNFAPMG